MVYRFGDQHGTAMSWADYMIKFPPKWAVEKEQSSTKDTAVVTR